MAQRRESTGKQKRIASAVLGLALVALLGVLDYATGPDLSLEIFFLIPVCLVVWFSGRRAGLFMSVLSTVSWFTADAVAKPSILTSLIPYWNAAMKGGLLLTVAYILPLLKEALEREKALARTDYLTGAVNKRYFLEMATAEINRVSRYKGPFTVAYLDIDNFKVINDRFGHNAGDTLLRATGETVRKNIRSADVIGRMGGDEFAILFPETQPEAAQIVMRRVQRHLLDTVQKKEWPVTFSMGVATFVAPPNSAEEMIKAVDGIMYSAKNSGKNRIKFEIFSGPLSVSP